LTKAAAKIPELITASEFARRLGVSKQAVSQAIAAGRITFAAGRRLDAKEAARSWRANTDQSKPRNSVTGRPGAKSERKPTAPTKADREAKKVEDSFMASRARRESWNERTAELEYHQAAGSLVSIADVVADAEDRLVRAKNASYDAADQFVPAVLSANSEPAARAALLGCLNTFFETLSKVDDDEDRPATRSRKKPS
jgi:hypothetical protein